MKTSELQGAALDWAVAKCSGTTMMAFFTRNEYAPSTDWEQGGPIIEREEIAVTPYATSGAGWFAKLPTPTGGVLRSGPTPLIAAMRCYVTSKLSDEVEMPEGLQ